jgi:hypothetical protein
MAIHNPSNEADRAEYFRNAAKTIDNSGISRVVIKAPKGFRVSVVNVSEGSVEFERMAVAAGAKKPKRKAGR